jgi:hypothetical protein
MMMWSKLFDLYIDIHTRVYIIDTYICEFVCVYMMYIYNILIKYR